jgi:hypothetical protein
MVITEAGPGYGDAAQLRDHANEVITELRGVIVRSGIRDHDPGMITARLRGSPASAITAWA